MLFFLSHSTAALNRLVKTNTKLEVDEDAADDLKVEMKDFIQAIKGKSSFF